MWELYEQAIVGIKAYRKVRRQTLCNRSSRAAFSDGRAGVCSPYKHTEDERVRMIFEKSIMLSLSMTPDIAIAIQFHDSCIPEDILSSLKELMHDSRKQYRIEMWARPFMQVGVPDAIARAFAQHIEDDRGRVIAFINEVGDPVMAET
ncbi:MAG: hypothetical protein RLZZ234_840 [Candidatus Parcubacteria bacterium]|jgi:hypothetical protein